MVQDLDASIDLGGNCDSDWKREGEAFILNLPKLRFFILTEVSFVLQLKLTKTRRP